MPESLKYVETFTGPADGKAEGVSVQLTCYFGDFTGELVAESEIEELAYLGKGDEAITSKAAWIAMEWLIEQGHITQ